MKAEIKDTEGYFLSALRISKFNVTQPDVELILNIVDYVKEKDGDVTLRDLIELKSLVKSLFED